MADLASDWMRLLDSFSVTADRNSTNLEKKQDLNVHYQVYVFGLIGKPRLPPCPLIGWYFFTSLKALNGIQRNLTESAIWTSSTCVILGPIGKPRLPPQYFYLFSESAEWNSTNLERRQVPGTQHPPPSYFFGRIVIRMCSIPKRGTQVLHFGPVNPCFSQLRHRLVRGGTKLCHKGTT